MFVTFDTYEHVKRMRQSGLPEEQAQAIIDAVKLSHMDLAGKHDFDLLEQKLERFATKEDLVKLDAKIEATAAALELKIIRWMIGLFFTQSGLIFAMLKFLR